MSNVVTHPPCEVLDVAVAAVLTAGNGARALARDLVPLGCARLHAAQQRSLGLRQQGCGGMGHTTHTRTQQSDQGNNRYAGIHAALVHFVTY